MKCDKCGTDNRKKAKFCKSCGEKIGRNIAPEAAARQPAGRKGLLMGIGGAAAVLALIVGFLVLQGGPKSVHAENGQIRISLNEVSDGMAHYFKYSTGGKDVKFFVLKANDGQVRAALDACDVCYREKRGYRQEGQIMVCNNCDNKFPADKINLLRGGCNPVPLERKFEGGHLVLSAAELDRMAGYF